MRSQLLFAIPLTVTFGALFAFTHLLGAGRSMGSADTVPTINGRSSFDPSPLATSVVCALLD
jgi:hypothetical protein